MSQTEYLMNDALLIQQVQELLNRRELAIFVGPDLPETLSGVPGWPELAAALAQRGGFPTGPWPVAAARYEQQAGRRNLLDWLDQQIGGHQPGPLLAGLAELPVEHYVTAAYDETLALALEQANRRPDVIIQDEDLEFLRPERPLLVKLLGEASAGQRASLLLTATDLLTLARSKAVILERAVRPTLTNHSLLIIGQDLRADYFRSLHAQLFGPAGGLRREAFAVWSGLDEWEVDAWSVQGLRVLDIGPLDLTGRLLGAAIRPDAGEQDGQTDEALDTIAASTAEPGPNPGRLRQLLVDNFTLSDLRDVAFDLGFPHEKLPDNDNIPGLARSLVSAVQGKGRLPELVETARRRRPAADWESLSG